jgi:hypothetical protein
MNRPLTRVLVAVAAAFALLLTAPGAANAAAVRHIHSAPRYTYYEYGGAPAGVHVWSRLVYTYASPYYSKFYASICVQGDNAHLPGSLSGVRFRTTLFVNSVGTNVGDTHVQTVSAPGDKVKRCWSTFPIYAPTSTTPRGDLGNGYPVRFETHGTIIRSGAVDLDFNVAGDYPGRLNTIHPSTDPVY